MTTVLCRKYQQELPALAMPPLPGPKGLEIQKTVSQRAWSEWQELQTRLINEKHLNLLDAENRRYLMAQLECFLNNEETDVAQGYVPPKPSE